MFKKTLLSILLTILFIPNFVLAYSDYLIVGGENIGIELKSNGVIVSGFYKVNDKYIAKEANLSVGDIIVSINDEKINSISDFTSAINKSNGDIKIGYINNDILKYTNLKSSNNLKTGLYIKDSVTGIGTLTYIDPNTKIFGALGHEMFHWRYKDIMCEECECKHIKEID